MNYLSEREYSIAIGMILAGKPLPPDMAKSFVATVSKFESLLDESDNDKLCSSWMENLGWND